MGKTSRGKILILGASGDIGSALLRRLATKYSVRAFSRKDPDSLNPSLPQAEWIKGDVLNRQSIDDAIKGVDLVFNTVGLMTVRHRKPIVYETNVKGLLNTVQSCKEHGIKRLVHISSVAVYGKQAEDFEEGRQEVTEENPLNAKSAYGVSKIEGERLLQDTLTETEWTIIRPVNLIGEGMDIFTEAILRALRLPRTPFLKGARATFNYIVVDNLVDLMLQAAKLPEARNQIFNAMDDFTTWEDMVGKHAEAVGKKAKGIPIPRSVAKALLFSTLGEVLVNRFNVGVELLQAGVSRRVYSGEKARRLLGWNPRISLDQAMAKIKLLY